MVGYSNSFLIEKQIISFLQTRSGILLCAKRPFSGTVQNLYYLSLVAVCCWETERQTEHSVSLAFIF